MVPKLTEEDGPIFARARDLALLRQRITDYPRGVTVLAGRPQQGKSRLLRQLVDNVRCQEGTPTHILGFTRASRQSGDAMLRALQDLYSAWLSDSNWREQARLLWSRHKHKFVSLFGKGAETLAPLLELTDLRTGLWRPVERIFSALNEADRDLKTASLSLPVLDVHQIQRLTQVLHDVTESPIVLVVDALEQSDDPALTIDILRQFLDQSNCWCPCHYILAVRKPGG